MCHDESSPSMTSPWRNFRQSFNLFARSSRFFLYISSNLIFLCNNFMHDIEDDARGWSIDDGRLLVIIITHLFNTICRSKSWKKLGATSNHMFTRVTAVTRARVICTRFSRPSHCLFTNVFSRVREKLIKRINKRARRTGRQVRRGTFSRRHVILLQIRRSDIFR